MPFLSSPAPHAPTGPSGPARAPVAESIRRHGDHRREADARRLVRRDLAGEAEGLLMRRRYVCPANRKGGRKVHRVGARGAEV